jgi:hypothetical protein
MIFSPHQPYTDIYTSPILLRLFSPVLINYTVPKTRQISEKIREGENKSPGRKIFQ